MTTSQRKVDDPIPEPLANRASDAEWAAASARAAAEGRELTLAETCKLLGYEPKDVKLAAAAAAAAAEINRERAERIKAELQPLLDLVGAKDAADFIAKRGEMLATSEILREGLAQRAAREKSGELAKVDALIADARAQGRVDADTDSVVGLRDLYLKHGFDAFEAHVDALPLRAPTSRSGTALPSSATNSRPSVRAPISAEERAFCERHGIDLEKFAAQRASEEAERAKARE